MTNEDRLAELLLQWEESAAQGRPCSPAEVCRHCPELMEEFRRVLGQVSVLEALATGKPNGGHQRSGQVPRIAAGRYRPLEYHNAGGLGVVFTANDDEVGRTVALKFMHDWVSADQAALNRFVLEAEVTGKLEHPGIVPVYGIGRDERGRPFYAMRLVRGTTLKEAIEHYFKIDNDRTGNVTKAVEFHKLLRAFVTVCDTVAYAHSQNIIHRDIKPSNILLGPYGETLLVDWGLAKPVGERLAKFDEDCANPNLLAVTAQSESLKGIASGTPGYMSPEQAQGDSDSIGIAADIFSLGATLYHILTGRPPYEGADAIDAARRVQFILPRKVRSSIPKPLEAVCLQAMSSSQEARYPQASALAADLERWLADEPVSAWREPMQVKVMRWGRRHKAIAFSGLVTLLIGSFALAALLVQENRTKQKIAARNSLIQKERDKAHENLWKVRRNIYLTRINSAAGALIDGQYSRARELLLAAAPAPGEDDDFRGFEWYHLNKAIHHNRVRFSGKGVATSLAISPDGRWIGVKEESGKLAVWDREQHRIALIAPLWSLPPQFSADSSLIAVQLDRRTIGVAQRKENGNWEELKALSSFEYSCDGFAVSPNGEFIAASGDGRLRLINSSSGEVLIELNVYQGSLVPPPSVRFLTFTSDGKSIAGLLENEILQWDVDVEPAELGGANSTSVHLKAKSTLRQTSQVIWLSYEPGVPLLSVVNQVGILYSMTVDGEILKQVRLPAIPTQGQVFNSSVGPAYLFCGEGKAWLVKSPLIVSQIARQESLAKGISEQWVQIIPCSERIESAATTSDGEYILLGLGNAQFASVSQETIEPTLLKRHLNGTIVNYVRFASDGRLFSASSDGVALFGPVAGETQWKAQVLGDFSIAAPPLTADVSPDGRRVAYRSSRNRFSIIDPDVPNAKFIDFVDDGHLPSIVPVHIDPTRPRIVFSEKVSSGDSIPISSDILSVWDYAGRTRVVSWKQPGAIRTVAYSFDGQWIAAAVGKHVRVYKGECSEDRPMFEWGAETDIQCLAFTPDGGTLAIGSEDGRVHLWTFESKVVKAEITLHLDAVVDLDFFADGQLLASGGRDGTIKIWNINEPMERCTLRCGANLHSLAISPKGNQIVAGCDQGAIRIFAAVDSATFKSWAQKDVEQLPNDEHAWRELSIASWLEYLEFRTDSSNRKVVEDSLKTGLKATQRLKELFPNTSVEANNWEAAFRERLGLPSNSK